MFWSLCSGFVREGLQLSLGQRVLYQGLNLLTSQFNLPTAQPRLSALASLLLNVSQPWAGSSGYLVFSSLVVFFFFSSSVLRLHPFCWSLTLCAYTLHSVRIQRKHRFLKFFFRIAPLSLGFCCTISISPSLFQLQSWSSQLKEIMIILKGYPSLCCSQEMVPRQKSRRAAGLTSLVFLLSDLIVLHCMLPTVCLHLNMWNNGFTFWSSSLVYGMRVTQS